MAEESGFLIRPDGEQIAWRRVNGAGPSVLWMGGFRSDMTGTKAQALADWAAQAGRAFVRFDYLGHGEASGDFAAKGTISRWREDALAVLDELTDGPVVVVGSSMGGWIACLAAMARPQRIRSMVLVAPAPDFTEKLMAPEIPPEGRAALTAHGVWLRPSLYGGQGGEDPDVPWRHALELAMSLKGPDVVFSLVRDGDHRLSRPEDIARLLRTVAEV